MVEIKIDPFDYIAYRLRQGETFDDIADAGFWRTDDSPRKKLSAAEIRAWYIREKNKKS